MRRRTEQASATHFQDQALGASARRTVRLLLPLDPVPQLENALVALCDRAVDAVLPGDAPVGRILLERVEVGGIARRFFGVEEEALDQERGADPAQDGSDLGERIL